MTLEDEVRRIVRNEFTNCISETKRELELKVEGIREEFTKQFLKAEACPHCGHRVETTKTTEQQMETGVVLPGSTGKVSMFPGPGIFYKCTNCEFEAWYRTGFGP
jgi:DNA-directed RNA polymerase subunit RPC12/RpoP